MEIVLASRNKKKIGEMNTLLSEYCGHKVTVLSLDDIGFSGDIEENGDTFLKNAVIKASVPASMGYIGIADDSGLCVDALDGAPGIYSARYSGEDATDEKNNEKLLSALSDTDDRGGAFVCTIALVFPEGDDISIPDEMRNKEGEEYARSILKKDVRVCVFKGECRGEILREYRGEGGFGYDPLFYIADKDKTFSELSAEEKNTISHRGLAMKAFGEKLRTILK